MTKDEKIYIMRKLIDESNFIIFKVTDDDYLKMFKYYNLPSFILKIGYKYHEYLDILFSDLWMQIYLYLIRNKYLKNSIIIKKLFNFFDNLALKHGKFATMIMVYNNDNYHFK